MIFFLPWTPIIILNNTEEKVGGKGCALCKCLDPFIQRVQQEQAQFS